MTNLIELLDSEFPDQPTHFTIELKTPSEKVLTFRFKKLTDAAEMRSLFSRNMKKAERHIKNQGITTPVKPWKTTDKEVAMHCYMMAELHDDEPKLTEEALFKFAKKQGSVFIKLVTAFEQEIISLSVQGQVEAVEDFLDDSE